MVESLQLAELAVRPRWWRRLRVRFVAVTAAIGLFCVGTSGYFVGLTIHFLDDLLAEQTLAAQTLVDTTTPLYRAYVDAKRRAYEAEIRLLASRIRDVPQSEGQLLLEEWTQNHHDVALAQIVALSQPLQSDADHIDFDTIDGSDPKLNVGYFYDRSHRLEVQFRREIERERTVDQLTRVRQMLGSFQLGETRVERQDVEKGLLLALVAMSSIVFAAAIAFGSFLARRTTRALSDIANVARRVASGELKARISRCGSDEVGQLARSVNAMLDELEQGRKNLVYLQRISAWQDLARRLAHEIKNPLTPIQLAIQEVRDKYDGSDPQFSRLLNVSAEIVEDEVESLRRLVSNFSQFSRLPDVRLEVVDANRVITEFERAYGHLTESDEDVLEVVCAKQPLEIEGDRQLLKNVLVNLVENAVLSARESGVGAIYVRVGVRAVDEKGGRFVEYFVEDNGPGVAFESRDLVFEPYFTTRTQGTGLGLAIAKKIALDHHGSLSVSESSRGGAAFILRLPRFVPASIAGVAVSGVASKAGGVRQSLRESLARARASLVEPANSGHRRKDAESDDREQ